MKHVSDYNFWEKAEKCSNLLQPILNMINLLEGDKPTLSYVYRNLKNLEVEIGNASNLYSIAEKEKILEYVRYRKEYIYHDSQLAACFLHPEEQKHLDNIEISKAMTFITQLAVELGIDEGDILKELVEYRTRSDEFSKISYWNVSSKIPPVTWWKGFFPNKDLHKIAVRLLSMPATTGSCERNFKLHANIKTKNRNRLTLEKTEKLVFIKHNLDLLKDEDFNFTTENDEFNELNTSESDNEENSENGDSSSEGRDILLTDNDDEVSDITLSEETDPNKENEDPERKSKMDENESQEVVYDDVSETEKIMETEDISTEQVVNELDIPKLKFFITGGKKILLLENYKL